MKTYQVYLAGPIGGLKYDECTDWRQLVMDALWFGDNSKIESLSPMRGTGHLKNEENLSGTFEQWPLTTQRGIYARDKFDCHRVDLVFVNFLGAEKVSIGTCMEIAWAAHNDTPIVLVMEDDNIHNHPMINEACPFVVKTLEDGIELTKDILMMASHD